MGKGGWGARRFGVYLGVSVGIECVFVVVLSVFPKSSSVSLPWNIQAQGARNKLGLLSLALSLLALSLSSLSISQSHVDTVASEPAFAYKSAAHTLCPSLGGGWAAQLSRFSHARDRFSHARGRLGQELGNPSGKRREQRALLSP